MSKRNVQWLYEELPNLVGKGIVPAETAEKLRHHYGEVEAGGGRRWALLLFGILGGALIGAGIILVLAHNWEELTRPMRAMISFLPLLIALGLAGFAIGKRPGNAAWGDGVGTFWVLAIGATISLVAQTYHISGDFAAFMLTWSLAALPIVYLLNCSVAAMLYWVGVTTWAGNVAWQHGTVAWYWLLVAAAVPHVWWMARDNRYRPRVGLLLWVLAGCVSFGIGFHLNRQTGHFWVPVFTAYFAVLYMLGDWWFEEGRMIWQRPLQTIGALGAIGLAIVLTFEDGWDHFMKWHDWRALAGSPLVIWPAMALGLWGYMWMRRRVIPLLFGALPVVATVGALLAGAKHGDVVVLVLMNLYALALGVALIGLGVRDQRLGVVNLGLLVTSTLIIARFFDSDMSILLRGLAFIAVGVGFLVTNVLLVRKKRTTAHPDTLPVSGARGTDPRPQGGAR